MCVFLFSTNRDCFVEDIAVESWSNMVLKVGMFIYTAPVEHRAPSEGFPLAESNSKDI